MNFSIKVTTCVLAFLSRLSLSILRPYILLPCFLNLRINLDTVLVSGICFVLWLIFNLGQNICRLFLILAQFYFTTSKTELDYYHQKVSARVASRVAKRLMTKDLRKLENFQKIAEMLGFDGEYPAALPKAKFWHFWVKNRKISAVKHSIEKPTFLNFVNLSPTFCPRLLTAFTKKLS